MRRSVFRILYLLSILYLLASPVSAQTTLVTGTVKDVNGVPYAAATLKAQLVLAGGAVNGQPTVTVTGVQACRSSGFGSSPCQVPFQGTQGPITLDGTGSFSLALQDNALVTPASTQWLFSVTSTGSPPPLGTGPQACSATVTITGANQSVTGNFSACPALSSVGAATASPKGTTDSGASTIKLSDPKYAFPGIGQWSCQAGITNGSNIITTQANDRPFTGNPVRNAQVGDSVWGSIAQCGGETGNLPTNVLALGTITSIDGPHQIHTSTTPTGSCTITNQDGCVLVWGPLAQTAVQAAWVDAGNACGTLDLEVGGGIILNAPPNNTTAACPGPAGGNDVGSGLTVKGAGPYSTMLLMRPDTTFGNVMFADPLGGQRRTFHDFGIASFIAAPAGAAGASGFSCFFMCHFYNMWFLQYFPSQSVSFVALNASGVTDAITEVDHNIFLNSGQHAVNLTGDQVMYHHNQIQNTNNCLEIGSGRIQLHDNVFFQCGSNDAIANYGVATVFSERDVILGSGASNPTVGVNSGSTFIFTNDSISGLETSNATLNCPATSTCIIEGESSSVSATGGGAGAAILNAGTLILRNVGASANGTGVSLNNSGTVTLKGGNTFPSGITNTGTINGFYTLAISPCSVTTPVTVNANATTDQNLMSCSIPGFTLNHAGQILRLTLSGVYSTPAASTTAIVIKAKLGALTVATWTSTALAGIQATNDQFNVNGAQFTVTTPGASGAFEAHGNLVIDLGVGNTVADSTFADVNTATVGTVDLTAAQTLQITIAFTVASASNSATQRQLVVETVN